MKIGNIELKYGLALAPMAGITDRAYRRICKDHGAEYSVSEMISAKAVHFRDKKTAVLASVSHDELPMGLQLFGSEPDIMAEAAKYLLDSDTPPSVIDINMGCPVRKIVSNNEGSALMRDPEKAFQVTCAVVKASTVPVTVKMRTGIDAGHKNAVQIAKAVELAGAAAICVHGRTASQLYAPPVDIDTIADVKRSVIIPVFGNGDINTLDDALRMLEYTGCDGLMLARGTMGNPWLFDELTAYFKGEGYVGPSPLQRLEEAERHIRMLIGYKGERVGVMEARKHFSHYIKGFAGAAEIRNSVNCCKTEEEFFAVAGRLRGML